MRHRILFLCTSLFLFGCNVIYFGVTTPQSIEASQQLINAAERSNLTLDQAAKDDLAQFLGLIQKRYYRDVDLRGITVKATRALDSQLADAELTEQMWLLHAKKAVTRQLDKHSEFLDQQAYARFQKSLSGQFIGIGVRLFMHPQGVRIEPLDGSLALEAGLQYNDVITHVGDHALAGKTMDEIVSLLRGLSGTKVRLSVVRQSADSASTTLQITVKRQKISNPSYYAERMDNIGYVRLIRFTNSSEEDLRHALQEWQNEPIEGLVFDLRQNGGGYFDQAIKVADMFLDSGNIVSVMERHDQQFWSAKAGNDIPRYPMIVLVDSETASSSEIVAEALSVHQRALIVGISTYGKGTVQSLLGLPGGEGLKLTTARFQSPAGHQMSGQGVHLDVTMHDDPNTPEDEPLRYALNRLQQEARLGIRVDG